MKQTKSYERAPISEKKKELCFSALFCAIALVAAVFSGCDEGKRGEQTEPRAEETFVEESVLEKSETEPDYSHEVGESNGSVGLSYMRSGNRYYVDGIGSCQTASVVVPDRYNGLPVTAIADGAFSGCESIDQIKLGENITHIGDSAFASCENLKWVYMPSRLKRLGNNAFVNCESLIEITVPEGIEQLYKTFFKCTSLKKVTLPSTLVEIGESSFERCESLITINIPDSVTLIGEKAFLMCLGMESVVVPGSVGEIPYQCFESCTSLKSITLGQGITVLRERALAGCSSLREVVLPDSLISIERYAMGGCGMEALTLPDSVVDIGGYAFSGCGNLKTVKLPARVNNKTAERWFERCQSLEYAKIPEGVTTLDYTFADCRALKDVALPSTLKYIWESAFWNCVSFASFTVPDGVEQLGYDSFGSCDNLVEVTLPKSVNYIDDHIFNGSLELKRINYEGSCEKWKQICPKPTQYTVYWPDCVVICSDGELKY